MKMPDERNELTAALFQRGALMDLHIGRWTAMKKMQPNDLLMGEVDLNTIYLGHKKLLPKKATEKLVEIEGKARTALASKSLEFPLAGARFVTYGSLPEVIDRLRQLKAEWNQEVEVLVRQYPELRETQLALLEAQAQKFITEELRKFGAVSTDEGWKNRKLELDEWLKRQRALNLSFYPKDVDELRRKFSFGWRMFQVSSLDAAPDTLDVEEVRRAQAQLREDLQGWVRSAAASMHQALGEAAANAKAMLEKNGKLTPRNLQPLFNAFENFLMVDFTGQSSFRQTIETIKRRFLIQNPDGTYDLPKMAEGMGTEASKAEFSSLLNTMADLAVEETAKQAGVVSLSRTDFGRLVEI
jgi:hypothetical protein